MVASVIIPTFNRARFIGRAINSVLNQSLKELEVIIVDDGSTDETEEIVQSFNDSRLTYIYQDNAGVSSARNTGVENANYDYIAFLDSDDEWLPSKLEKQISKISQSRSRFIHTAEKWMRDGEVVKQKKSHQKHGGDMFIRSLANCVISPSTSLMEKSLYRELEGMREDFVVCEDYDFWLKLTSLYEIDFIEEELIIKNGGHDDQLSFKFFAMDYWRVKSMAWIAKNRRLNQERLESLCKICTKKSEYLLRGYEKYQNFKDYDEVKEILDYIRSVDSSTGLFSSPNSNVLR